MIQQTMVLGYLGVLGLRFRVKGSSLVWRNIEKCGKSGLKEQGLVPGSRSCGLGLPFFGPATGPSKTSGSARSPVPDL